jgi:hypothetical protein
VTRKIDSQDEYTVVPERFQRLSDLALTDIAVGSQRD